MVCGQQSAVLLTSSSTRAVQRSASATLGCALGGRCSKHASSICCCASWSAARWASVILLTARICHVRFCHILGCVDVRPRRLLLLRPFPTSSLLLPFLASGARTSRSPGTPPSARRSLLRSPSLPFSPFRFVARAISAILPEAAIALDDPPLAHLPGLVRGLLRIRFR